VDVFARVAKQRAAALRKSVTRTLVIAMVAPELPEEQALVELAAERLEDFLDAIDNQAATIPLRAVLLALNGYIRGRYRVKPENMSAEQREQLVRELCEPEAGPLGRTLERVRSLLPIALPGMRQLTGAVREMVVLAYYSSPGADRLTGYVPAWKRPELTSVLPSLKEPPPRFSVEEVLAKQRAGRDVPARQLFAYDGRPRVAVIGSGAGGAVAAARLAKTCDVAIFEAGPSFLPHEYPLDTLAGLALMFKDGLMTFTEGQKLQMLQGRLVGGGTVMTSGMSIRPRKGTLASWHRQGIDHDGMNRALDAVERRLRLAPLNDELLSDLGYLWRAKDSALSEELLFEVPLSNTTTHAHQHEADPHGGKYKRGERCLACGLCNYGCRFGHKLSMDLTYIPDAKALGARVHANLGVHRVVSKRDPRSGETRVSGIVLQRDKSAVIEVDHVVLACGAVGTPQLLLRSMAEDAGLASIAGAGQVGKRLGFNYGTTVLADFGHVPPKPGEAGVQIHYVASKPGDDRFVLENAYLPPALLSSVIPGSGAQHRDWMKHYKRLSMIANTIGSPQTGVIKPNGMVSYDFGPSELDLIHESIVTSVRSYLRAGASRVAIAGVRGYDDTASQFFAGEDTSEPAIRDKVRRIAPDTDRLMMMSAHLQGGMVVGHDPASSAVSPDFHVHGVKNLMVADASLFPSTIVVNVQWAVMAVAQLAAEHMEASIHGRSPGRGRALNVTLSADA
jgi:choline dehydrogenase-like flavoprotein